MTHSTDAYGESPSKGSSTCRRLGWVGMHAQRSGLMMCAQIHAAHSRKSGSHNERPNHVLSPDVDSTTAHCLASRCSHSTLEASPKRNHRRVIESPNPETLSPDARCQPFEVGRRTSQAVHL